jgi:hypothetical protein
MIRVLTGRDSEASQASDATSGVADVDVSTHIILSVADKIIK